MSDPSNEYDLEASTLAHAGEYAKIVVPICDTFPSQEYVNKWVVPFYRTNLVHKYESFESNFRAVVAEIDDQLINELLMQQGWRSRLTAAYFVAIKKMTNHCDHIGKLLLRSDVCYAGGGYALALARINTLTSLDYLKKYLHHYLRRPDLAFDQADVLGAVNHCDKLNDTAVIDEFRTLWAEFRPAQSIDDAISWFDQKMNSINKLAGIV